MPKKVRITLIYEAIVAPLAFHARHTALVHWEDA
jgi:hypothetical protein